MNVSVVIATYGHTRWKWLAYDRALGSVLKLLPTLAGQPEVVTRHDTKGTLAQVRNAAAESAQGEWLCFLDADDELEPGYLAEMERGWLLLAHGDHRPDEPYPGRPLPPLLLVPAVSYNTDPEGTPPRIPNRGRWPHVNECVIGTLIQRELFLKLGGFHEWPSIEDYDLFLRAHDAGAKLAYIPGAIYRAFRGEGGGRNADQSCYGEIWREHEERLASIRAPR